MSLRKNITKESDPVRQIHCTNGGFFLKAEAMLTHLHSRWFICFPKLRFSDQRKTPQWQTGLCPNKQIIRQISCRIMRKWQYHKTWQIYDKESNLINDKPRNQQH